MHETTHQPLLSTLSAIVETVVRLCGAGHKVILVSSGAIGVGLQRMVVPARPKSLSGKQASFYSVECLPKCSQTAVFFGRCVCVHACVVSLAQALAVIGQRRLIALWDNLFGQLGQPIAQVLLTRGDISDVRASFLAGTENP